MPSRGSMRPSDIGASLCGHLRACAPSELRTERTKLCRRSPEAPVQRQPLAGSYWPVIFEIPAAL